MIWSLIKVLLFVAVIGALAYGATALLETGGGIRIEAMGMEFLLGPLQAVILIVALIAGLWLLMKVIGLLVAILRFINGDETSISRYFDRNRERKGYQALSEGLVALASGESRIALARAAKAEKLLGKPELTSLLIAQAADAAGDKHRATAAYKALVLDEKTRFVGVRGLMMQKLDEGDTETALKLAEKAFALKPKDAETQDILLKLQADALDWKGARGTLGAKMKAGALPKDVYRRRDAILALQEAKVLLDDNASIEAREAAISANKQSPDLIPAAAMAGRALATAGDIKGATRVLKKAWEAQPHPDLAAACADILPHEEPQARLHRFKALTVIKPEHPESKMLLAELNIAAEGFPAARRAIGDLATTHPTARALTIMAAIERGEGSDDAIVRGWLAKALTAPRGPQWCCDKCQAIHAAWSPICKNCSGFDTLSWREPPEGAGPSATGTELLPLMVRPPEPAQKPAVAKEEEPEVIDLAAIVRGAN